jgi:RHH-type transcriptional regulator, rel operon repressor / antitoxin RelB
LIFEQKEGFMPEIITDKPLNVRLPLDLAGQLDALTKATGKTKSFLTIEALREYLEVQAWQVQDIQDALVEADQGKFASEKEVTQFFAKYER